MDTRTLIYRFGFRLACFVLMLIALSIMTMTYFFNTREPEAIKEISGWFEKVVMALVAVFGGLAFRTLHWLSRQPASATDGNDDLLRVPKSRSAGAPSKKITGRLKSKGTIRSKGTVPQPRGRRDPGKK